MVRAVQALLLVTQLAQNLARSRVKQFSLSIASLAEMMVTGISCSRPIGLMLGDQSISRRAVFREIAGFVREKRILPRNPSFPVNFN